MSTWYLYYSSRYEATQPFSGYSIKVFQAAQKHLTWSQYNRIISLLAGR